MTLINFFSLFFIQIALDNVTVKMLGIMSSPTIFLYYEPYPCLFKLVCKYRNYKLSINIIMELLLINSYYLQLMIENENSPFPHTKKLFGSFCWFTLGHDIVNKFIFCFNMACGTVCYIFVSRLKTDLVSCIKNSRP